jgi:release factor glutamine methyltransferase
VPGSDPPNSGLARAWEAGADGRALLDRICAQAPEHLRPGGFILLVHSEMCGTEATLDGLRAGGLESEVIARRRGALGPLMSARVQALEQRGLLPGGQREEEVVVIRGRVPAGTRHPLPKAA